MNVLLTKEKTYRIFSQINAIKNYLKNYLKNSGIRINIL